MDDRMKTLLGLGLLAALAVGFVGGSILAAPPAASSAPATIRTTVLDPTNATLYAGDVHLVGNATALGALEAAASAGNFTYAVKEYPSLGAYVYSIAGTEASGNQGWIFRVLHDGAWCWGAQAPDRTVLQDGDAVTWQWGTYQTGCNAAS